MCNKSGPQLGAADDLLHRQVRQEWIDDGEPSSQAFYPWRDVDDGCWSVDRGSMTTAAAAFRLFTDPKPQGFEGRSAGVWSVSHTEVAGYALTAWEDPVAATATEPANGAHALVEFGDHDKKRWKGIGRKLKALAIARGRQHP